MVYTDPSGLQTQPVAPVGLRIQGGNRAGAPIASDPSIQPVPGGTGSNPNAPPIGGGGGSGTPPGTAIPNGGLDPNGLATGPAYQNPAGMTPYNYQNTFSSGSSDQQQSQVGSMTGNTGQSQENQNIYDPASLAMRGQGAGVLSQILATGQLPGKFGVSQQAFDALNSAFERNIAPGMAAQFGAGSSAISSQEALMNQQLAATLGQQQWQNFNSIFDDVANFSFTPTGQHSDMAQNQSQNTTSDTDQVANWQQNNTAEGSLLSSLLTAGKRLGL